MAFRLSPIAVLAGSGLTFAQVRYDGGLSTTMKLAAAVDRRDHDSGISSYKYLYRFGANDSLGCLTLGNDRNGWYRIRALRH
jgi:hypothetical protein